VFFPETPFLRDYRRGLHFAACVYMASVRGDDWNPRYDCGVSMVVSTRLLWPFATVCLLLCACSKAPSLTPYSTQQPYEQIFDSPVVVVGVITSDQEGGPTVPCVPNSDCPMQLRRLTIRVENGLRGRLQSGTVSAYYFRFAGGFSSPGPLGWWGDVDRRIFWLREDSRVWRLACDGHNYCAMPVRSGAHPQYRADPNKPLGYAMADIWFTRGQGTTDEEFARGIDWGAPSTVPEPYLFEKLQRLAATERAVVRAAACKQLSYYGQECIAPAVAP
jgi:hypothetical protein